MHRFPSLFLVSLFLVSGQLCFRVSFCFVSTSVLHPTSYPPTSSPPPKASVVASLSSQAHLSRNIEFATKKKTNIRLGDFACLRLPPAGSIIRVPGPPNRKEARGKEMKGWERNRTVGPNPEKGKQRRQPAYYNFYFNFNFILLLFFVCTTWSGLPGQAIPVGSLSFCRDAGKTRLAWLCPFFCLYNSQTTMRIVLSLVSYKFGDLSFVLLRLVGLGVQEF